MNDIDMELQAIRQKLQSLQSVPPTEEALTPPWSPPRSPSTAKPGNIPSSLSPNQAQVTAAIETLKQRSHPNRYGDSSIDHSGSVHTVVGQEVQRFQTQVSKINLLAQQQAEAVLGLKQLAEEIEYSLQACGVDNHPELEPIANFFAEHDAASVLTIGTDRRGNYCLDYQTLDFYQAEHDAASIAQTLRDRSSPLSIVAQPSREAAEAAGFIDELLDFCRDLARKLSHGLHQQFNRQSSPRRRSPRPKFTVFDVAIWFSGAAIIRVLLNVIFDIYPVLWTPLMVGMIVVVAIALYRNVLTSRPSIGLSYRILVSLAGLFVGGQFL